jgi:hypothetical protein
MIFPGFVYISPGPRINAGRCFDHCLVTDESVLAEKLAAGWSNTVEEAYEKAGGGFIKPKVADWRKIKKSKKKPRKPSRPLDGINHRLEVKETPVTAPDPVADDSPVTRDEMEAKAVSLGLKFDGRTTDRVLLQRIQESIEVE